MNNRRPLSANDVARHCVNVVVNGVLAVCWIGLVIYAGICAGWATAALL